VSRLLKTLLDPLEFTALITIPVAHLALGYANFLLRRTDNTVEEFRRALQINPNFAARMVILVPRWRSTNNRSKPLFIPKRPCECKQAVDSDPMFQTANFASSLE
jgi:hypothetical protein